MYDLKKIVQIRPGRVAALLTQPLADLESDAAISAAVRDALKIARQHDVRVVQSLVDPADVRTAGQLESCGFSYLTDVLYLVCPRRHRRPGPIGENLRIVPLDATPEMQTRLRQLMLQTYQGSQDCPRLNELRPIDDVLTSYRAVGRYQPQLWFVARAENADVGCIFLAEHPAQREMEIVYLGVVPQFRGRGIGRDLVRHAQQLAADLSCQQVGLAVDAQNQPALAIYRAAGFEVVAKHRLFLHRLAI